MLSQEVTVAEAPPINEGMPAVPQDREAEEATVGSVLINPEVWPDVAFLAPSDFYRHPHVWIWEAFRSLHAQDMPIDLLTLAGELERKGQLSEIGGRSFLTALVNQVPTSLHTGAYAKKVKVKAARRQMLAQATQLANDALDESKLPPVAAIADPSQYSTWADMDTGPIEWAWPGWLVKGLLTLLVSYSGDGKSLLALRICGCFINGQTWPDGTPYGGERGKVLWCEAEAAQKLNQLRATNFKYPMDQIITPLADPFEDISLDDPEHRAIIESARLCRKSNSSSLTAYLKAAGARKTKPESKTLPSGRQRSRVISVSRSSWFTTWASGRNGTARQSPWTECGDRPPLCNTAAVIWALSCPDATNRETKRLEQIKNNLGRFTEAIGMTATEKGIDFGEAPSVPHTETASERAGDFLSASWHSDP